MTGLIVDLHLHSKYSRATSKDLDLAGLYLGAKIKGIDLLGTGDFTHPIWFGELQNNLVRQPNGLYRLKQELEQKLDLMVPASCRGRHVHFVPTVEISCIYSRHQRVRKLHNVIVMPTLELAAKLNQQLSKIGNLSADGRPILGMDSYDLLKLCLTISQDSLFIPAHIWTPWFGMFGSKSGFDSLEEAFGDLSSKIYAVETGLSSDPQMNWRVSDLDNVTLVSHSDAHSTAKLGREANVLDSELSYKEVIDAIKTGDKRFVGTIEFFPQEGKYYADGHRKCKVMTLPAETTKLDGVCPVCGKPLTVGVLNRVEELSQIHQPSPNRLQKRVEYIVPLPEILAELKGLKSTKTKTVQTMNQKVIESLGDEFSILRQIPVEKIQAAGFDQLSVAIKMLRQGDVEIDPGYDGVYGCVTLKSLRSSYSQLSLLSE